MASRAPSLACPRCGYDVSGVVPTWTESCPLDGTCSECGLGFAWVDIHRPERLYPAWSFEHVTRRRVRAFIKTAAIALRPGKMWREMSMGAPIRAGQLAIFLLLIAVLVHVAVGTSAIALSWDQIQLGVWTLPRSTVLSARAYFSLLDWQLLNQLLLWPYSSRFRRLVDDGGTLLVVWGLIAPLPYLILAQTMRQAKCRRMHLLRGWVLFWPVIGTVVLIDAIVLHVPLLWMTTRPTPLMWSLYVATPVALFLFSAIWYIRWWTRFTKDYLQLAQPRLVAGVMIFVAFLGACTACLFLNDIGNSMGYWLLRAFG